MISHSKPKRRKTKRDDFSVWFGDIGSTYVRKKIYHKKKKKKVSPTNIKPGLSGPAPVSYTHLTLPTSDLV